MGIEDLNLDLSEHADRILFICANEPTTSSVMGLLEKRGYRVSHFSGVDEASKSAGRELFDAAISFESDSQKALMDIVAEHRAQPMLARTSLVLLYSGDVVLSEDNSVAGMSDVYVLPTDFEPGDLLVRLTMLLRLRKLKSQEAQFDEDISAQNVQLRDLTTRFKREVLEAQTIQRSLLPKALPNDKRCIFAATYVPLEAVGGDLYDIWELATSRYGMFIGDVTGHGLPAAFIGAMTKMALAYAPKDSPDLMLAEMNNGMSDRMPDERFITVAAAIYHADSGKLQIARGGHPPPYIWRTATRSVEQAKPKGMALGMVAGVDYELYETTLEPGDKMLMITDGLTETTDMDGKMLGVDGVAKLFATYATSQNIAECIDSLFAAQESFTSGRLIKDDNTAVGLERVS